MILQRLGMPIYLQVKSYIMDKIKAGDYPPGSKLPTERNLAAELGISRNTVSAAYKELLIEGVLEARQGRGTFVCAKTDGDDAVGGKRERLLKLIDSAMMKAQEMGFSFDQFAAIVSIRAQEKANSLKGIRLGIVGCATEYLRHYAGQIGQTVNVRFEVISLDELKERRVPVELLAACDMVLTTTEHQVEVVRFMGGDNNRLLAVNVVPNLEAMIKIARLPVGTKVGVVAESTNYVEALKKLLVKTMIEGVVLEACFLAEGEQLQQFVTCHDVIIVAEERQNVVRRYIRPEQDIISFFYEIDQGSLNRVLARLATPADNV